MNLQQNIVCEPHVLTVAINTQETVFFLLKGHQWSLAKSKTLNKKSAYWLSRASSSVLALLNIIGCTLVTTLVSTGTQILLKVFIMSRPHNDVFRLLTTVTVPCISFPSHLAIRLSCPSRGSSRKRQDSFSCVFRNCLHFISYFRNIAAEMMLTGGPVSTSIVRGTLSLLMTP